MMFSRAASLRRLAAPAASSLVRPAAAASGLGSSSLSTTAKRAPKEAEVPAPEASAATAPQQAASDRPLPPHFDPAEVKRPTKIPFQSQIENTVHLVGTVGVLPVLEEKSPGECQAVSVIVEKKDLVENDLLQLCIPVIFQGDLAQIASCHLKENDLVYIVGHLSGGEATTKVEDAHSKIRIFARSLSFVESNSRKVDKVVSEQDKKMASDHSGNGKDESWWTDVFANPGDWNDNRIHKQNGTVHPQYPDFKHKSSGQPLWLGSAPGWVQSKLDGLKPFGSSDLTHEDLWKDVIENPTKWWDTRLNKRKPTSPDFTHKDSGVGLWLNSSPSWVLEKLPPAENITNSEDLWKDAIENPTKWWDKRLKKRKPTSPDFMHKDSGVGLWLNSSPSWVLEKLPPTENITNSEYLWNDVIENPTKWWDYRLNKRKPTSPDFTHKDSGDALWLSSSPAWVLEKLPPAENITNSKDLWKDVIENPTKWWDIRLNKRKPTSPDFVHKGSGVGLCLSTSPSWVLEKLPPAENTTNSEDLWKDLIENPTKWWDDRLNKRKPTSPDFVHKDSGDALWLSRSPSWVLERLPPAESTTSTVSWVKATSLSSGEVATNTENWAKATILS